LAAISEPHGINQNVLVTLHNMVGLQLLHLYIFTQKSKMAAAIGGYFLKNLKKTISQHIIQHSCKIPTAKLMIVFKVKEFNEDILYTM
jgi:hypothetical protein